MKPVVFVLAALFMLVQPHSIAQEQAQKAVLITGASTGIGRNMRRPWRKRGTSSMRARGNKPISMN